MTWTYVYTPGIWPSAGTALFLLLLAGYSWRWRRVPGTIPLMAGCLFGAAIAVSSVLEYAALDATAKLFWYKTQAAIMLPVVTALFCFILEFAWPRRWLTRRNLILVIMVPAVFIGLIVTNDFHHLAWVRFQVNGTVRAEFGPANWVIVIYTFLILGAINLLVFGWLFLHSWQHRWPVALMLVGQVGGHLAWTMAKAHVFQTTLPIPLFAMAFEFFMYALAFFGFRILDPLPLARNTAIEQLNAGMLVLDPEGMIVSLNPAAEQILRTNTRAARGKPVAELLPAYTMRLPDVPIETVTEISLGTGPEGRLYQLDVSALKDWRGLAAGCLLMLHDVTEQKQAQRRILEQQRALATLQERERLARELHDGIGQVLGYVKMQSQSARDQLVQGQTAEVDRQLAQLTMVAQDAHADVREYILGAKTTAASQPGFLVGLRQYLKRFSEVYELRADLVEPPAWRDDLLEPTVEAQLLRIIQEALTNVRKHARATCVHVVIQLDGARLQVIVQDDGAGFDPPLVPEGVGQNYGLGFLRERADEAGGSVAIHSAPGQGTRVIVDVPRRNHENFAG